MYTHTCICTYIYMYKYMSIKILATLLQDANDCSDGKAGRGEGSRNFLDSMRSWRRCDERRCLGMAVVGIKEWGRLGKEGSEKLRGRGVGRTMCGSPSVISYITFLCIYLSYFILLDVMHDTCVFIYQLYVLFFCRMRLRGAPRLKNPTCEMYVVWNPLPIAYLS